GRHAASEAWGDSPQQRPRIDWWASTGVVFFANGQLSGRRALERPPKQAWIVKIFAQGRKVGKDKRLPRGAAASSPCGRRAYCVTRGPLPTAGRVVYVRLTRAVIEPLQWVG